MSKFDKIFEARDSDQKDQNNQDQKIEVKKSNTAKKSAQSKPERKPSKVKASETVVETIAQPESPKRRGRPSAKRSDPDFVGFTTYIRKSTHLKVKIALLQEGQGRELSELVEELFDSWLKQN